MLIFSADSNQQHFIIQIKMYQHISLQCETPPTPSSPASPMQLNIFSHTEQTIHLYEQIMSEQYFQNLNIQNLQDDLAKFFNGLIWAEKKNPLLVYQMFEMKSCHAIVLKYIDINPIVILRNSILLLGNCQVGGLVAEQLVEHGFPHCLLSNILKPGLLNKYKEEIGQYIGNFMKCYYKLFKVQWLQKFILEGQYFQLLEINLKYYNCPDFMARTNAFNIVLDLLRHTQVRNFISNCNQRSEFYMVIFQRMTQLFRNQLTEFGLRIAHISHQDSVDYIFTQLEDKIALWFDISNNFKGMEKLLQLSFCNNIIVPLVIGPLQTNELPLFSLKYSLYVLTKLFPTMRNLNILQIFIRIVFIEETVFYDPGSLRKAFIQLFSLQKLLSKDINLCQYEDKAQNKQVKSYYRSIFTSKDNHFILMTNCLLKTLFQEVKLCPTLAKEYGFQYNGQFCLKISRILLSQLKQTHNIYTIQSIIDTLIFVNNLKPLSSELQNQFIYIYQHIINQLKNGLHITKNLNENIFYLGAVVQYDVNFFHKIEFGVQENYLKYQNIFKIVFQWEAKKQEMSCKQFYARRPDSPCEYLRYLFAKFMLLKKGRAHLFESMHDTNLYETYYQQMLTHCPYISDDIYSAPDIEQPLLSCEILYPNEKNLSPAYWIKNNSFFILGKPKGPRVLITHGVKIKHISIQQYPRKKMKILIKDFDDQSKQIQVKQSIIMKYDEILIEHIKQAKHTVTLKNINFITKCLKNAEKRQQTPSLI